MRFDLLRPDDERWSSFLSRTEHDIYHLPAYCSLLADERKADARACYGQSHKSALLVPLLIERLPEQLKLSPELRDAKSPDGYPGPLCLGNASDVASSFPDLMAFLRERQIVTCFLRTHPTIGMQAQQFEAIGNVVERGRTIGIPLKATYEETLLEMRQSHRYEIRRAIASGYKTVCDRWELLPRFVSLYRSLMDRVDAADTYRYSDRYFHDLRDTIGDSAHIAFVIAADGSPVAGALFTHRGDIVQYHLAASDPRFAADAVQKLVIDALIRYGLNHGAAIIHLGGGVGAGSDTLLQFKAGFSQSDFPYRTIELTPDPEGCRAANEAWSRLTGMDHGETGFFPAYRAPLKSVV